MFEMFHRPKRGFKMRNMINILNPHVSNVDMLLFLKAGNATFPEMYIENVKKMLPTPPAPSPQRICSAMSRGTPARYIYIYTYIYIYMYMYMRIYIYMYIYVFTYITYTCTSTYTYAYRSKPKDTEACVCY